MVGTGASVTAVDFMEWLVLLSHLRLDARIAS